MPPGLPPSLRLTAAARRDFRDAARYYDGERPGLGDEFRAEVTRVLGIVARSPALFATVYQDVRRVQARPYPYGVFYRNLNGTTEVFAIVHLHRDPGVWQRRV